MQRFVEGNQRFQEYWVFRDGKMYNCNNDNKDPSYHEYEMSVDDFVNKYGGFKEEPYPEIITFLKTKYDIRTEADEEMAKLMYR